MGEFEGDFVNEELVAFEIEGRKFKYKPTTAGEENSWLNEYMNIENGKPKADLSMLNKLKLRNLKEVPYEPDTIQKVLNLKEPTSWEQLKYNKRWELLSNLKADVFNKIINTIDKLDKGDSKK